jgi:transcriptional regulator with XRE-family HTH domain
MAFKEDKYRKNLEIFMKRKGLTSYSWAKMAGITEGTIRSYIAGRSNSLTYNTLAKLANCLGVNINELVDPEVNYEEYLDHKNYLQREIFEGCMQVVDDIIEQKNIQISAFDRRRLYLAWYDIKNETTSKNSKGSKTDLELISAMLKILA